MPAVLELIKELAVYEKAPDEVVVTVEEMERDGFGKNPVYWFHVAEVDSKIVGVALNYIRYSTWKGKCVYLEDIIVHETYRGNKIGKMLFERCIQDAKEMKAKRLVWQVLDWNEPAVNFYRKYNASFDEQWLNGALEYEQIQNFQLSE